MARFIDAITNNPDVKCFRVINSVSEEPCEWELDPIHIDLLSDMESDGYHIITALNVLEDGTTRKCYMDMNLPERISDYAFFLEEGSLVFGYYHQFSGEILPANAIDCFGVYDQFYSQNFPEIGIEILKRGLAIAKRKHYIAEDLGYIYRDEQRFREAVEMFKIAVDEEPSSYFIYGELADAYAEIGDTENAKKYSDMFDRENKEGLNI